MKEQDISTNTHQHYTYKHFDGNFNPAHERFVCEFDYLRSLVFKAMYSIELIAEEYKKFKLHGGHDSEFLKLFSEDTLPDNIHNKHEVAKMRLKLIKTALDIT